MVDQAVTVSTPDEALELARDRTGLSEIGSESWRPGLAILSRGAEHLHCDRAARPRLSDREHRRRAQ